MRIGGTNIRNIATVVFTAVVTTACGSSTAHATEAGKKKKQPAGDTVVLSNRMIEISEGVNLGSIKKAQKKLLQLDAQSHEPIWMRINSPGGSVDAGLILIDTMHAVKSPLHCIVESKAYSMGAMILVFCDKRYGYPHSTYMLHEASYGTVGDDPSNRSKLDFLTKYLDKFHEEIAGRLNMDSKKYRARIRDAWWMLADEAKEVGLIQEIITDMSYFEFPVEKTEEKRTITYTKPPADGDAARKPVPIPKRRD